MKVDVERDPAIFIEGLTKGFPGHLGMGRTPAVRGLDLVVRPGEILGLLGPDGAGKTTTIKMLLGLQRPDQGTIRLFGLAPGDPSARARVGFLPQNPCFHDYLTAKKFLEFHARLQGMTAAERKQVIGPTLERVGLAGREQVVLRKFSREMLQRIGLAQAIQHDPELLILDEPMSGLDPSGRREVRDLILSLRDSGKTVFFSSSILQDVEMICDRVAILLEGRVHSSGPLEHLIESKLRSFEVSVRGVAPDRLPARLISRDAEHSLLDVGEPDSLSRLLAVVQEQGGEVSSVFPRRVGLEELLLSEAQGSGDRS